MKLKKIGYQGVPGAYSEKAAKSFFEGNLQLVNFASFDAVFKAVEKSKIDFGVIPLENSVSGSIAENFDHLVDYKVHITGEIKLRVKHRLLGLKTSKLANIKMVKSHPQALAQCQKTLKSLGTFEQIPYFDTAGAVESIVKEGDPSIAAIASESAALAYPVKTLKNGIEDNPENYTRFVIISRSAPKLKESDKIKTSLVYALKNIPGALFKSLSAFATRDIDLLKIESRPIHGSPFKYLFYVDFADSADSISGKNAIRHLGEISEFLKVLGSYKYK